MLRDRIRAPASAASHPFQNSWPPHCYRQVDADIPGLRARARLPDVATHRHRLTLHRLAPRRLPLTRPGSHRRGRPLARQRVARGHAPRTRPVVRSARAVGCIPLPSGTCGPRCRVAFRRSSALPFLVQRMTELRPVASVTCVRLVMGIGEPDRAQQACDLYTERLPEGRPPDPRSAAFNMNRESPCGVGAAAANQHWRPQVFVDRTTGLPQRWARCLMPRTAFLLNAEEVP